MAGNVEVNELNDLLADVIAESKNGYDQTNADNRGFRDLKVWQVGMDFVASCYEASAAFPQAEQYGLTNQTRRASVSIVLNIAEGCGRNGKAEFARYIDMAAGSLNEADACLDVAVRLGYKTPTELIEPRAIADRLGRSCTS